MDADPCGATKRISNHVLDRHVRSETGAVADVGGFSVGAVRAGDVMMVTTKDDWTLESTVGDGSIHFGGNRGSSDGIGIQNAGPGPTAI